MRLPIVSRTRPSETCNVDACTAHVVPAHLFLSTSLLCVLRSRTVASFAGEQLVIDQFAEQMEIVQYQGVKGGVVGGLGFGFSNFVLFGAYALSFWYRFSILVSLALGIRTQ